MTTTVTRDRATIETLLQLLRERDACIEGLRQELKHAQEATNTFARIASRNALAALTDEEREARRTEAQDLLGESKPPVIAEASTFAASMRESLRPLTPGRVNEWLKLRSMTRTSLAVAAGVPVEPFLRWMAKGSALPECIEEGRLLLAMYPDADAVGLAEATEEETNR